MDTRAREYPVYERRYNWASYRAAQWDIKQLLSNLDAYLRPHRRPQSEIEVACNFGAIDALTDVLISRGYLRCGDALSEIVSEWSRAKPS